ncbi:hypothetical protein C2R22_13725 [Salinigranum rubrum]|uniref:PGF-pre-PGF domain-containing protein n=1 Tax=Salinigranum rubrum TaxID=755307 RepID=A0A2I8VKW3_9EURY|nr:PGF-pre-PGF domain-containing protein [Salinigranum rubrum]AUV82566.1 hypothetical protein C2R22_13725 [Salinigranum rubrum]
MQDGSSRRLFAAVVAVLVVTGTVPAVTAGAFTQEPTEPRAAISGSEFVDASGDVEVWNRAALPLRTDPNDGDTVVKNVDPFVEVPAVAPGKVRLNKDRVAVYDDEAEIQLQFRGGTGYGTSAFAGADVQLVAAHVEEDTQTARELLSSSSALTTTRALDLLTGSDVNENVHFDLVEGYGTLDGSGEITGTYDLGDEDRGAGFYVFFLVQDHRGGNTWGVTDQGFEESNGELAVENESRVLGVDVATVHQQPAEASLERTTYTAGDDLTFDVDAKQGDGDVTHAVVVYNRRQFENKDVTVTVDGDLNGLTADDVSVEREVGDVNGVATVSGSPGVFGLGNLQDGQVSGLISGARLVDFVAEQAEADAPLDRTTNDAVTLDASVTVVDGGDTEEVTVETFENWSTGQYGYLYVATGENSRELTTTRGDLTITPARSKSGGVENGRVSIARLSDDVPSLTIDFGEGASGNVKIAQRSSPGNGIRSVKAQEDREDPLYLDIEVPEELRDHQSTIDVTVRKSSLAGLAPDEVSLWHYTEGRWTELDTRIRSQNATHVTYVATTGGFSPFAIAQGSGPTGTVTPEPEPEEPDSGPSVSSGSGGGGVSTGSRTLFSVTKLLYGGTSIDFDVGQSSEALQRVSLTFSEETAGQTAIGERDRPRADTDYPRNYDTVLTVVDTTPPNQVADRPGTVTLVLKRSAVDATGVAADSLRIQQYDEGSGTWQTFATDVVAADDETVTLSADVSTFGTFLVSTAETTASTSATTDESTDEPTATLTPTAEPLQTQTGTPTLQPDRTAEPTSTDTRFPGLGVTATLVAGVLALLLGWRRRQR